MEGNLILVVIDVLSILIMSVIMVMGAQMTFRLLRGGIWARPARIILLAGSFYYVVRIVDLFDDLFGFFQTQSGIVFNNASNLVFSVLFFVAIFELYRVLKRLTLPLKPDHIANPPRTIEWLATHSPRITCILVHLVRA